MIASRPGRLSGASGVAAKGFTLVEVTVAVAVIAIITVAVGALLQNLPKNARNLRDENIALAVARTQLEALRAAGYESLPASGPFASPLLASLPEAAASTTITEASPRTKQVVVAVSWRGADTTPRSISLTTLVTQNSGLP